MPRRGAAGDRPRGQRSHRGTSSIYSRGRSTASSASTAPSIPLDPQRAPPGRRPSPTTTDDRGSPPLAAAWVRLWTSRSAPAAQAPGRATRCSPPHAASADRLGFSLAIGCAAQLPRSRTLRAGAAESAPGPSSGQEIMMRPLERVAAEHDQSASPIPTERARRARRTATQRGQRPRHGSRSPAGYTVSRGSALGRGSASTPNAQRRGLSGERGGYANAGEEHRPRPRPPPAANETACRAGAPRRVERPGARSSYSDANPRPGTGALTPGAGAEGARARPVEHVRRTTENRAPTAVGDVEQQRGSRGSAGRPGSREIATVVRNAGGHDSRSPTGAEARASRVRA